MKRRSLLSLLLAGSAGSALAGGRWSSGGVGFPRSRSVLVLLELRGGNDGLNTLAPIGDPLYRQARPTLALDPGDALPLDAGLALHPALAPLLPLWQSQRLAFALGVGWAWPNRSHFKAADQWATASPSGEGVGWLAAALDRQHHPGPLLALGPAGCPAMEGGAALALQLSPAEPNASPAAGVDPAQAGSHAVLRRMLALEQAGAQQLQFLRQQLAPLPPGLEIPPSGLGQQVALALRLIGSDASPPVLQLAQGGYDTHADQAAGHGRVLGELAAALAAFAAGLERLPQRPPVTLLAVSEFGRRLGGPAAGRSMARSPDRPLPQPQPAGRSRRPDPWPQPA
ncbi:MAG: DUF1501 domain-containing protein [Synechococcus sp.]|nr:DUF1501 domain-containing protein [Synechococcus sp.]